VKNADHDDDCEVGSVLDIHFESVVKGKRDVTLEPVWCTNVIDCVLKRGKVKGQTTDFICRIIGRQDFDGRTPVLDMT